MRKDKRCETERHQYYWNNVLVGKAIAYINWSSVTFSCILRWFPSSNCITGENPSDLAVASADSSARSSNHVISQGANEGQAD